MFQLPPFSPTRMDTSPIEKLNDDILLTILDTITCQFSSDSGKNRPLTVIRAASQVCQRWRELLLESPGIWGRVIDLYHGPTPRRKEWMDEVVKRAGSAPLWISGNIQKPSEGSKSFNTQLYFIHLLKTAWERTERLSVTISGDKIPESIQNHFLSPAPMLRSFDVYLDRFRGDLVLDTLQSGSSQCLFANHAPSLQSMTSYIAFKPNSSWLSNIKRLFIPRSFTLQEIFSVLQHTPVLESIQIDTLQQDQTSTWDEALPAFAPPNLPNLAAIDLVSTPVPIARILEYIISLTNLSRLRIQLRENSTQSYNDDILSSLKQTIPVFISSYFASKPGSHFRLSITSPELRFCEADRSDEGAESFGILIKPTTMPGNHMQRRDDLFTWLMETLTLSLTPSQSQNSSLSKPITELRLDLPPFETTIYPKIHSMLAVFQHVQVIETNEKFGQTLWDIIAEGPRVYKQLFPELRTLCLSSLPHSVNDDRVYEGLTSFLMHRDMTGFPVRKLDLTGCRKSRYAQNCKALGALEEVHGLEVVWKDSISEKDPQIFRYICGAGNQTKNYSDIVGLFSLYWFKYVD